MLIATAGHVDHGKTTLIKALTGVETDRLAEEKKRGLTIELGFAYMQGSNGSILGFVDVPGHHRFVRTMASGVSGIDLALLVVAADDGVMPQTLEHIAILDLLGISRCIVAISRIDRADASRVKEVRSQIQNLLKGTSLLTSPNGQGIGEAACFPVNATENVGVDALKRALLRNAEEHHQRPSDTRTEGHYFRLAVDRSFSLRGAGTVVTGTVMAGSIAENETIKILPGSKTSRVRSLHINGAPAQELASASGVAPRAQAGQRAALNLVGLETTDVVRGNWLTSPELDIQSSCVDVRLKLLPSEKRAFRHWSSAQVHIGASAIPCRIALYDHRTIAAGEQLFAQLVFARSYHMLFGDHFVLRDQSASRVIGGGVVVDPFASRTKKFRRNRPSELATLQLKGPADALLATLANHNEGLRADHYRLNRNLSEPQFDALLIRPEVELCFDTSNQPWLVGHKHLQHATDGIVQSVKKFHSKNPSITGPLMHTLRMESSLPDRLLDFAFANVEQRGLILKHGNSLQHIDFEPKLDKENQSLLDALYTLVAAENTKPPAVTELATALSMERAELLSRSTTLVAGGFLVLVSKNRLFHPQAIATLGQLAVTLAAQFPEGFDAKAFRDASGIGRNISIDVLEYLDKQRITRRIGDRRSVFRRG